MGGGTRYIYIYHELEEEESLMREEGVCEGKEAEHSWGELYIIFFDPHSVTQVIWNLLRTCADYFLSI